MGRQEGRRVEHKAVPSSRGPLPAHRLVPPPLADCTYHISTQPSLPPSPFTLPP